MPYQNLTTTKIFHMSRHNYQKFPITKAIKNSYMSKVAVKYSYMSMHNKKIPTYPSHT